jgi:hypothetical protein
MQKNKLLYNYQYRQRQGYNYFRSYRDGATPTRFGTKPLKSPAIPSYLRMYLNREKKTEELNFRNRISYRNEAIILGRLVNDPVEELIYFKSD